MPSSRPCDRGSSAAGKSARAPVTGPVAGQPGHRDVPGAAAADPDDRGDPAPPPGPGPGRPQRLAAFVFEDDPAAERRRGAFIRGQVSFFHTSTALSSRSIARRAPIWQVQPRRCSRYQIPGWCTAPGTCRRPGRGPGPASTAGLPTRRPAARPPALHPAPPAAAHPAGTAPPARGRPARPGPPPARLRSASFCRFLASGQSPACTALKIRPRSRHLLLVEPPVHTLPGVTIERGQALRSVHRSVQRARQFQHLRSLRLKRLTCPRERPCGPEHQARYPAGYTGTSREETRPCGTRLPAAFRPPAFASWAPCPAKGFRPSYDRPTDRPAPTRACRADPGEVSTFRTHETRTGPGALYTPGTAVFAGRRPIRGRRLPPLSDRSLSTPAQRPNPGCISDEASARVP